MNRVRLFGGEDPEVRVHAMNPSQVTPSVVSPFGPTGPACRVYRYAYMHSSLSTLSLSLCVRSTGRTSACFIFSCFPTKRPFRTLFSCTHQTAPRRHTQLRKPVPNRSTPPPLRYEPHMYRRYAKNKKSGSRPALPPIRLYLLITISCSPYRETLEVTGVYGTCETPPLPLALHTPPPLGNWGGPPAALPWTIVTAKPCHRHPLFNMGINQLRRRERSLRVLYNLLPLSTYLVFFGLYRNQPVPAEAYLTGGSDRLKSTKPARRNGHSEQSDRVCETLMSLRAERPRRKKKLGAHGDAGPI